jgi:hypothetical protein
MYRNSPASKRSFQNQIMTKSFLFAAALLSLALATSCAKGGNGIVTPPITLDVTITSPQDVTAVYATQSVTVTATPSSGSSEPVNWTLTGGGTLTPVSPATTPPTAIYVAPAAATSGVSITATETSDSSVTGSLAVDVVDVSVIVTPVFNVSVGENLTQYFTAVAVPDYAPQTFSWSCTQTGSCGTFTLENQTPTYSGLVSYTAPAASGSVVVSATSTVSQSTAAVGQSNVKVVASRLAQGSYAFRFNGYNSAGNAVAVAGSVAADANGNITSGVEDVVTNGVYTQYTTVTGSYAPTSTNNNQGTLTLSAGVNGPTFIYTAVLTAAGTIRMIESGNDGSNIRGSGVMQKSAANTVFNAGAQTFAFGFEGLDVNGNRVGYAGVLPMTPGGTGGTITGGLMDSNDNGAPTTYGSVTGAYGTNLTSTTCGTGTWNMKLTAGGTTFNFDFFIAGGQTKTSSDPLTLYVVSCDATNQALSGNMVYQFPMSSGYNNAAFAGTSVSALRGVHTASSAEVPNTSNVALVDGKTDGMSSGSGGTGGFAGTSDQNDNGNLISIPPLTPFSYTYCSTITTSSTCTPSSGTGRYIFNMLGNPNASPAVSSIAFVLYATGANRGFLLDQSSRAVMTGEMAPQPSLKNFAYAPDELPGTYAVATIGNSDPALAPEVQNLLLTSTGGATYVVAGTEYTSSGASESIAGSYTINYSSPGAGTGTVTLTDPAAPLVTNYVIYAIDASAISGTGNDVITDFMMMGLTAGTPSTIMFAQQ